MPRPVSAKTQRARGTGGISVVLGLWLTGIFAAPLAARIYFGMSITIGGDASEGTPLLLATLVVAVLWPLVFFVFSRNRFMPRLPAPGRFMALLFFVLFGALSILASPVMFQSIAYFCMTLAGFLLAMQFNSSLNPRQYERGLKIFSVLTTAVLILFALYDYKPGLRLGNGRDILNPNAISIVGVSAVLAAYAIRTAIMRYLVAAAGITVIALTGSRASMVAALAGLFIIFLIRLKGVKTRTKFAIFGSIAVVTLIGGYFSDVLLDYLGDFFALHSRYRGIEAGASGRFLLWRETWQLFLDNPVIGVGFRAHEYIIKVGTSAHNGYLAMLAEIGLFGFASVIYLIVTGIGSLWREANEPDGTWAYSVLVGVCFGYLLLAMFERYLINVGNPTSLLFLLGILRPARNSKSV